ncbi:MAG TPA: metalloregulator ArsR/SmtB family transcription factor [Opitutales bacterium]|nr:metalloregulator ArsR/SmtB family transcription factor [Opitutales bacterium]
MSNAVHPVSTARPSQSPTEIFKALGNESRVTIVRSLLDGAKCVCDLVAGVGLGWSTVSRHLSVLREAGIIADEKRGQQIFYHLTLPCVGRFIACLENPAEFPELHGSPCGCD